MNKIPFQQQSQFQKIINVLEYFNISEKEFDRIALAGGIKLYYYDTDETYSYGDFEPIDNIEQVEALIYIGRTKVPVIQNLPRIVSRRRRLEHERNNLGNPYFTENIKRAREIESLLEKLRASTLRLVVKDDIFVNIKEVEQAFSKIPEPEKLRIAKKLKAWKIEEPKLTRKEARTEYIEKYSENKDISNSFIEEILTIVFSQDEKINEEIIYADEIFQTVYNPSNSEKKGNDDRNNTQKIDAELDRYYDTWDTRPRMRILHLVNPNPKGGPASVKPD